MNKNDEEKLEKLNYIMQKAQTDLKNNHVGYENCRVKNVLHYNKKVKMINKKTKETEELDLYVAIVEDPSTKKIMPMYYLNGKEVDFEELLRNYESLDPIKDVIDKTRENEEKPKGEQDKEYTKDDKNKLEKEKEDEKDKKDEKENNKEGKKQISSKAEYVIQTINVDSTYIDDWTTVSKGFKLPPEVKKIAIAYPNKKDDKVIASDMTIYMLDDRDNIIKDLNVKDYFQIDDATGNNPMYDDNTKFELEGHAERNKGQTMRRFKSMQNVGLYLSAEQKKVGQYVEVYAGTRTRNGNDPVETQLETDNTEIQTSLEMQKINARYKGEHKDYYIDKEADEHEEHGDDEEKIAKENADGYTNTKAPCDRNIYLIYEALSKIKENDYIKDNYSDEEIIKNMLEIIDKKPDISQEELIQQTKSKVAGTIDDDSTGAGGEQANSAYQKEKDEEDEWTRVPWDFAKH